MYVLNNMKIQLIERCWCLKILIEHLQNLFLLSCFLVSRHHTLENYLECLLASSDLNWDKNAKTNLDR